MSSNAANKFYPSSGQHDNLSEPIRGDRGGTILGPRNAAIERENPDLLVSPSTDAGTMAALRKDKPILVPDPGSREVVDPDKR